MACMATETGIRAIPYTDIPVKSPDASPMDVCGFGLLKRGLGNRRPALYRVSGKHASPCVAKEPPPVEVEVSSDSQDQGLPD